MQASGHPDDFPAQRDETAGAPANHGVAAALLAWYDAHARALPWRSRPGTPAPDPYRVWLSEVMLQQTTVAAVGPYFEKFTRTWPTVHDLAAADDAAVMAAWAGLGSQNGVGFLTFKYLNVKNPTPFCRRKICHKSSKN